MAGPCGQSNRALYGAAITPSIPCADNANLDVHTWWQAQTFVECLDRLPRRLENIDQPFVRSDLELLSRFPVDVRATENRVPFDSGRERDRPVDFGPGLRSRLYDFRRRPIEDFVVVTFHPDADSFVAGARHADLPASLA
jgi:hypothetical protein